MNTAVLAFYCLTSIEDPHQEVIRWKKALTGLQAHGRIYISHGGINAQMSVPHDQLLAFRAWLTGHPSYSETHVKVHAWHEHVFEKLIVKFRKQLVAFDTPVDLKQRGRHVSPEEWQARIEENDPRTAILDVRNQFEYDIGHFEGAIAPECNTFRDYRAFVSRFAEERDPKNTRVLMYCTGGIRCEIFSAYLKGKGFDDIGQLDGGIIEYGLKVGSKHWKGKLFVFDDRMTIPLSEEPCEPIAHCTHCQASCDDLYNCANAHCNELFISCPICTEKLKGCCSSACSTSSKLRPLEHQNPHKPFRKWHLYANGSLPVKSF